ncbi:non-histone protein [Apophysomyces ossiformis]|uniref:Non-histone protein n=1 Tax=Apophysomyces ossiformis TaxID=679940 RepID=A0A8H7BG09_9FUNG|nr:non-histone protein [Apophysomyces ossiformis]
MTKLKRRVREIEEDNNIIQVKLHKAERQIKRLRVERLILLEQLDDARHPGKSISDTDVSETESGMSEVPPPTKGSRSSGRLGGATVTRKKKDPNAPKGPGNVFFLYCRMERDKIKDELPNEGLGEVTRALGQKWKALTKEEKQKYYDLYKKEQGEYEEAMKSYTAGSATAATETKETSLKKEEEEDELEEEDQEEEEIDMLQEDEEEGDTEMAGVSSPTAGQSSQ